MFLDELLERRLIILSGKGGVGKSVVGTSIALAARTRGRRILFLEVQSPSPASRFLGERPVGHEPVEVRPNLWMANVDPAKVMEEYVREMVKIDYVAGKVIDSAVYARFFTAAPGLPELMVLGKIMMLEDEKRWHGQQRWDHIVLDAPATGHGLAFLKVPLAASNAVPVGPVGNNARRILKLLRDPRRTALVVVAIPEEMAVVEALDFRRMAKDELDIEAQALVLNACHERRLDASQEAEVLRLGRDQDEGRLDDGKLAPGVTLAAALASARRHIRRRKLTQFYLSRVKRALDLPVVTLPFLFTETLHEGDLEVLMERIEAA